jgi:hypothetical protein
MGNLDNVVEGVAGLLPGGAWLEYVVAGNLPGRPNGSALVILSDAALHVAEFDTSLCLHERRNLALPGIKEVALEPYARLGMKRMANLTVTTDDGDLEIQGIAREPAEHLAERLRAATGR